MVETICGTVLILIGTFNHSFMIRDVSIVFQFSFELGPVHFTENLNNRPSNLNELRGGVSRAFLAHIPGKVTSKVIILVKNFHIWGQKSFYVHRKRQSSHAMYNPTKDGTQEKEMS